MERVYDTWNPHQEHGNELYTTFKFSRVIGIGKDPTCTRRDPTKGLKVDDWGLCHINPDGGGNTEPSFIAWFDCNLTQDLPHDLFKENNIRCDEQTYFQSRMALPEELREAHRANAHSRDRDITW